MKRRELLASAGLAAGSSAAWNGLLAPVRAIAADAKLIRIRRIETFTIVIPATDTEVQAGVMNRFGYVLGADSFRGAQVGDGAGHF